MGTPQRLVGRLRGSPGATVIVLGGVHGNEPEGLVAARRLHERLSRERIKVTGDLVLLAGNLRALREGARFVDRDLNRQWVPDKLAGLGASEPAPPAAEDREQQELLQTLREIVGAAKGPIYFVDLHTSSAPGPPFLTVGDTLRNRRFARRLGLPLILGLEEQVDGSLLEFLNDQGLVTVGVEAGQHGDPRSAARHEAVLWLVLVAAGLLEAEAVPERERLREELREASSGIPPVVEVRCRHAIRPEDRFRMRAGFTNFDPVQRGDVLAEDRHGAVTAPESGLILLPLYQGQGDDGFFVARRVWPVWLGVSALLRRMHLDRLMPLLPGVRRHPQRDGALVVDTRVARFYPLEVFHLLGFRKRRRQGDVLVVTRRRFDLGPPEGGPVLQGS